MGLRYNAIIDVPGIKVGHASDDKALTGCSVILCEGGAIGGVDIRGGAPGTRETDAMKLMHLVNRVHAIVLSGGSAFGLDAAGGVMQYLEERKVGFDMQVAIVPIVASAILFDLGIGDAHVRPDARMGYQACLNASDTLLPQGNVGAGCGATVGKILGMAHAMKSGIGSASLELPGGIIIGALVAVNALGDIVDPHSRKILAGARAPSQNPGPEGELIFVDTMEIMKMMAADQGTESASPQNTTIGVVVTNACLSKEEINKVAQMAQNGLALTIQPAHTMYDGDTIFALATNEKKADVNVIGAFAVQVVAEAIVNAVRTARPVAGLPSCSH